VGAGIALVLLLGEGLFGELAVLHHAAADDRAESEGDQRPVAALADQPRDTLVGVDLARERRDDR